MIILLVVKLYLLYIDFKLSEHKYRTLNKQRNAIEDRRKLHSRRLKVVAFLKPPAVYGGVK
jgi:hypothetical protein